MFSRTFEFMKILPFKWDYKLLKIMIKSEILASIKQMPQDKIIRKNINNMLFEFNFTLDNNIKKMYLGNYSPHIIYYMEKYLSDGDTFIDIGANIGYLSMIGANIVGKNGSVHAFEPVPYYFKLLKKLAQMNNVYKIIVNPIACGEKEGIKNINITSLQNIGWNTMVPNFMKNENINYSLEVKIHRLDKYILANNLDNISLIKIDVEGFEFPVLKGLSNYFENDVNRPIIICEIAPSAYPLLGYSLEELYIFMKRYSYHAFDFRNSNKELDLTKLRKTTDIIFKSKCMPIV